MQMAFSDYLSRQVAEKAMMEAEKRGAVCALLIVKDFRPLPTRVRGHFTTLTGYNVATVGFAWLWFEFELSWRRYRYVVYSGSSTVYRAI